MAIIVYLLQHILLVKIQITLQNDTQSDPPKAFYNNYSLILSEVCYITGKYLLC